MPLTFFRVALQRGVRISPDMRTAERRIGTSICLSNRATHLEWRAKGSRGTRACTSEAESAYHGMDAASSNGADGEPARSTLERVARLAMMHGSPYRRPSGVTSLLCLAVQPAAT